MYLHIFLQDVENLLKLKKVTFLAFYKKFYDKHLILSILSTLIYSISTKQKTYIFCTISLVISLSINSLFLKNEGIFCRKKNIHQNILFFVPKQCRSTQWLPMHKLFYQIFEKENGNPTIVHIKKRETFFFIHLRFDCYYWGA